MMGKWNTLLMSNSRPMLMSQKTNFFRTSELRQIQTSFSRQILGLRQNFLLLLKGRCSTGEPLVEVNPTRSLLIPLDTLERQISGVFFSGAQTMNFESLSLSLENYIHG